MVAIANNPFVLKDMLFQVGTDNYEAHVRSVKFTPTTQQLSWQGGTPASSYSDVTNPVWTAQIILAQDWKTANSLAQYLLTNAGQTKVVVFKPQGALTGAAIFTVSMIMAPCEIGGDVNTYLEATVSMGCIGAPVKTANP